MGLVTNVMISTLLEDGQEIEFINVLNELVRFNHPNGRPFFYVPSIAVGGSKSLGPDVFIAAFNYLDIGNFKDFFKSIPDKIKLIDKDTLQVMVQQFPQHTWSIYNLKTIDNLQPQ